MAGNSPPDEMLAWPLSALSSKVVPALGMPTMKSGPGPALSVVPVLAGKLWKLAISRSTSFSVAARS